MNEKIFEYLGIILMSILFLIILFGSFLLIDMVIHDFKDDFIYGIIDILFYYPLLFLIGKTVLNIIISLYFTLKEK